MLIAAQSPPAATGLPSPSVELPAMAAARANRQRVKVNPEFKSGPDSTIPEGARAAGEFGKVVISGIIGTDGRFSETRVVASSRSPLLDSTALGIANATLFEPAKDANGAPLAVPAQMPIDFSNAHTPGKGGGVLRYGCTQFARDYDWWFKTWPAGSRHDDFYLLVLGLSTIVRSRSPNGSIDMQRFGSVNRDFEVRWKAAVEACRASPDRLFIDVFKPEGDFMRGMARKG
jgi:TonB family protein